MHAFQNTIAGQAGVRLSAIAEDRMRIAAELLIAGVAFQESGKVWNVFSHEGDHIGELSTFMVNESTRVLRSLGLTGYSITNVNEGECCSITFGHHFPCMTEFDAITKRRYRKFSTIH